MNRRLLLAVGVLAVFVALAGCSTILGPGEPDPEEINQNVTYDWNTSANVTVDVAQSEYTAIYVIDNQTEVEFYRRDALGTENPLDARALKFQFENGTVRNVSVENVSLTRKRAVITLPARDGQLAFTSPRRGKSWSSPTFIEGTYDVTLPPGARVGIPILGQVSPAHDGTEIRNDRVTIHWDNVERRSISVRYYLTRDLWLFGSLLGIGLLAAAGGLLYYLRQIRSLERRREEVGLDVDVEDDRDDPPPGMG